MEVIWWLILALVPFTILVILYLKPLPKKSIENKHIVVIGGSSGIGQSTAILAAKLGAHVTIIARNIKKLEKVQEIIKGKCLNDKQIITAKSVDVSEFEAIEKGLEEIECLAGPIYMLINCAGLAICGIVEDLTQQQIKQLVNVNFLGSLYPIQAIVPKLKQRKEGILVLTGSQLSLMGMYGMSVYSSCKFALRGLAESLYMELKPYNISVTLSMPPDTDTPGFENENKTKPTETKLLSEVGGLLDPEIVAQKLLDDALAGKFFSYVGFESFILTTLCIGMTPFTKLTDVIYEAALLGPLRLVSAFYIVFFANIIKKCHLNKENEQKKVISGT